MTATPIDKSDLDAELRSSVTDDGEMATVLEQLSDQIGRLEERVETLEAETDQLEDTVAAQAERINEQADQLNQLREETENLAERQTELESSSTQFQTELVEEVGSIEDVIEGIKYGLEFGEFRPTVTRDIAVLQQAVDDLESDSSGADGDGSDETDGDKGAPPSPIERVSMLEKTEHGIDVTPCVRRATALYENLREWATRTTKGHVLKTKNGLRDLLSAETGEQLSWKQVYRACRALDRLAKGAVQFHRDNPRHGKMLVMPKTVDGMDVTDDRRQSEQR